MVVVGLGCHGAELELCLREADGFRRFEIDLSYDRDLEKLQLRVLSACDSFDQTSKLV